MSPVLHLVAFGLRQVVGGSIGDSAEGVVKFIEQRFTDHSQALPRALATANDQAWQSLGIALAGDGLLDQVKTLIASSDQKAFAEQVRLFLGTRPGHLDYFPAEVRRACLAELKQARQAGLLSAQITSADDLARRTGNFQR